MQQSLKNWLSSAEKKHLQAASAHARATLNELNLFTGQVGKSGSVTTPHEIGRLRDLAAAVIELARTPNLPASYAGITDDDYLRLSGTFEDYHALDQGLKNLSQYDGQTFKVSGFVRRGNLTHVSLDQMRPPSQASSSSAPVVPLSPPNSADGSSGVVPVRPLSPPTPYGSQHLKRQKTSSG